MRNLASHWTIDGTARELNRRADLWEFVEDPSGRMHDRLYGEMLLHENTCMVLSLARYRMMMKGQFAFSIRRFKILGVRKIDPSSGKTVATDWSDLIAVAEAVYGHELNFGLHRVGEDRDKNNNDMITVYYDEEWQPTTMIDPLLSEGSTLFTEHEEFKSRRGGQE